jgi:hypothetical protein
MPIPEVGSSDAQIDDETIQRGWDRFAMIDLSAERKSRGSRRVFTKRSSTNATVQAFNSPPTHDSTTTLGGALARPESIGVADNNADLRSDCGE